MKTTRTSPNTRRRAAPSSSLSVDDRNKQGQSNKENIVNTSSSLPHHSGTSTIKLVGKKRGHQTSGKEPAVCRQNDVDVAFRSARTTAGTISMNNQNSKTQISEFPSRKNGLAPAQDQQQKINVDIGPLLVAGSPRSNLTKLGSKLTLASPCSNDSINVPHRNMEKRRKKHTVSKPPSSSVLLTKASTIDTILKQQGNHLEDPDSNTNVTRKEQAQVDSSKPDTSKSSSLLISFPDMSRQGRNRIRRNKHKSRTQSPSSSSPWKLDVPNSFNPPTNSSSSSSELRNKNQPDQFDSSVMKITRQMSSGYYGEISHAVHTSSRKPYCIKKLSKQECMDPILIQREIAIHSRLSHENIVQFIGAYQTFDDVFLVMELCHGDLHDEMISVSGPGRADGYEPVMSLNEASWYVAQVLDAVSYLNRNHVYHRDIKPENLLLCSPPRRASSSSSIYGRAGGENSGAESQGYAKIKLCDFGWSVHAPPTTNHDKTNGTKGPCTWRNTFCGTAEYVPVEMVNYIPKSCRQPGTQHQSVWYDVRFVDCWAIGILAYELVIGVTPFYVDSKDQSGWMMMKGYYKKREVIFDRIREIGDHVEFLDKGPGRIGMDVDVDSDGSVGGSSLDADFCNFVESMTKRKPELRLTADQALLHDWIRSSRVNK